MEFFRKSAAARLCQRKWLIKIEMLRIVKARGSAPECLIAKTKYRRIV